MPRQQRARKLAKTLHPSPSRSPSPSADAFESPAAGPSYSSAASTQSIKLSTTTSDGLTDDDDATVDSSRETTPEDPISPYSSWADLYDASGTGHETSVAFLTQPEYARQRGSFNRLVGGEFCFTPDPQRAPLAPFFQIGLPQSQPFPSSPSNDTSLPSTYRTDNLGLPLEVFLMVVEELKAEPSHSPRRWVALRAYTLTCRAWYHLFAAKELQRHIHLGGDSPEKRDLVSCTLLAVHEARIAGNLRPFVTESYTFAPRGVITGEENLYKGLLREETVRSIEVNMGHLRTEEEEGGLDGFAVADFLLFQGLFQNLGSICLTPGLACTQLDIRHRLTTAALRNLRKLCVGDTARTPSDGLPNTLHSILSGVTESFELELVFSDANKACKMVHHLVKLVTPDPDPNNRDYLPNLASSLISLKFSRTTPPLLVQAILPLATRLQTLIADHDLSATHLSMFLTAPHLHLTTLGIAPLGFLEDRSYVRPVTFNNIANALRDGALSALTTIEYHSRDSKDGRLMAIEDCPELLDLEEVCEGMGIAIPERRMPTLDDPL
ncbi:hypothetical protein RQP46_007258 [Phenoliferia psychrophenolica]